MLDIDPSVIEASGSLMDRLESTGELTVPLPPGYEIKLLKEAGKFRLYQGGAIVDIPRAAAEAIILDSLIAEELSLIGPNKQGNPEVLRHLGLEGQPANVVSLMIRRYERICELSNELKDNLIKQSLENAATEFEVAKVLAESRDFKLRTSYMRDQGGWLWGKKKRVKTDVEYHVCAQVSISKSEATLRKTGRGKIYVDNKNRPNKDNVLLRIVVPRRVDVDSSLHARRLMLSPLDLVDQWGRVAIQPPDLLRLLAADAVERQGDAAGIYELFDDAKALKDKLKEAIHVEA